MLPCLHALCVFANQRVAKGTIENQDDEIVSCRDGCDENSVGALLRFSTYTVSGRVLFPKQSGTIRGARSAKDETRR